MFVPLHRPILLARSLHGATGESGRGGGNPTDPGLGGLLGGGNSNNNDCKRAHEWKAEVMLFRGVEPDVCFACDKACT